MTKNYDPKVEEILSSFDYYELEEIEFSDLEDKTLTAVYLVRGRENVTVEGDMIIFCAEDGTNYYMFHHQDCCEYVTVEDICGDLEDLVGSRIRVAECVVSRNRVPDGVTERTYYNDLYQYTFYKLDTFKGGVTIRWFGSSNGYYSVSVRIFRDRTEEEKLKYDC